MDRSMTCWQCKHLADTKDRNGLHGNSPVKSLCEITHRWGGLERGRTCDKFEYKQWHNSVADDGTEIKNRQPLDYRTENQWLESGRRLKQGAVGKEMYASRHNMKKKYRYYLIEETEENVTR
ncbi:hypothetical protein [Ruminococcus sp.]|uniref:hypothetical protein n=1 Tax=Ruminococcus sp. TaxID=41978 RepID=UPI002E81DC8E|nr:hypothetical protein [Ruminococcus sp.]MEE3440142.1 hypothetical protein [Ruminococcus sp.]